MVSETISIQFLGAAGTVTGSKYLITAFGKRILVDCGLFQGLKKLRLRNWNSFPIPPSAIDIVLLTHGHLDHVGYLPLLVKNGYHNPIWATTPTAEIANIILEDSGKVQEEEAETANRLKYSKHKKPLPLYTVEDAEQVRKYFVSQPLDRWVHIGENISMRFRYNSHILGAAFIELKIAEKVIVFSGDIGRDDDPLLYPPQQPDYADIVLIESTYGDKQHPKNVEERLSAIINNAIARKGTIIIPSFAVERAQLLMYHLWKLRKANAIGNVPVFMDSPMGSNVLDLFHHSTEWHKLSAVECTEMCSDIRRVQTVEETEALLKDSSPKIVIAGGGMVSGGRVMQYLQQYLPDASATILLAGYQAEGTRGRQLLEGAAEIKLLGEYYSVRATVESIQGLSAHADQAGLLQWMKGIRSTPEKIFLVHGEPQAADVFRVKIKDEFGWECEIPELDEIVTIDI